MGCLAQLMDGQTVADLSSRGRLLGDLQQCTRLVQDAMHRQGLDAASGADWLRRQRLHPPDSVPEERQPYSDLAASAIAVVTVHRSKGLQYPVVICPYLWEAPSAAKGPLWRNPAGESTSGWHVALNTHWGLGQRLALDEAREQRAEAERLAYVAVTRAERHLVLFQAQAAQQDGNPLAPWLEGQAESPSPWISVHAAEPCPQPGRWRPRVSRQDLECGPIPTRGFDRSWGRSSYSAGLPTTQRLPSTAKTRAVSKRDAIWMPAPVTT